VTVAIKKHPYLVACSPQAWASGGVFQLLQTCPGLTFTPENPLIRFYDPRLPDYLEHLENRSLYFDNGVVDSELHRNGHGVRVDVIRKEGSIKIDVVRT